MPCIDNIVTLGVCPDEAASLSGFTLLQAAGMSPKIFANIANENYISGAALVMAKKALALNKVRNDFMGALHRNAVMTNLAVINYVSSRINTGSIITTYAGERGLTVHKTHRRGGLRKTYLKTLQLYPLDSGDTVIKIIDGYTETHYEVTLVAGQINSFDSGYEIITDSARVIVDQTNIRFASTPIICHKGCGGQTPNDCAWVDGWDGTKAVKGEGYGVLVEFYCQCDYDSIVCDINYMGEIIWLRWQLEVFDEQLKTNRFNNWVVYGHEELPEIIQALQAEYTAKWNDMMDGLYGILKQYSDACLDCRGIRRVTNI